jgi:hypothetical protein
VYCFGCAEESKGGDGDATATEAHVVKGSDGEEKEDAGSAPALPHVVAGDDGEEELVGGEAAALPHAVASVVAPSVYSCAGAE